MSQLLLIPLLCLGAVEARSQHLGLALDPPNHRASIDSTMQLEGSGELRLRLTNQAEALRAHFDGKEVTLTRVPRAATESHLPESGNEHASIYSLAVDHAGGTLTLRYHARFEQDVAAGERPGQIHNYSVDAHIGPEGVFLSDGSAWHPQPLDGKGFPALVPISIDIAPVDGMALVASGEPAPGGEPTAPRWSWSTPRPVDGMAVAGGPHQLAGRVHRTIHGPVEVVMHSSKDNAGAAPIFLDAACRYLDLYVPLLGAFPYQRFTIVENFFSSGFAYPGFTLLSSQVVKMGERALAPGYLDHELVHNWWGNGVYVDPQDGNWCEALTSYCTNYGRRLLGEGAEAAKAYRRDVLMRLSGNPAALDNAPLGDFGRRAAAVQPDRFVGYEKGTFFFIMLQESFRTPDDDQSRVRWWRALRRFGQQFLGRRASWDDLKTALEAEYGQSRTAYFESWVRRHTVPATSEDSAEVMAALKSQIAEGQAVESFESGNADGRWIEPDPEFKIYRTLPARQIIPTLGGTMGIGGVRVFAPESRPEIAAFLERVKSDERGGNLLLVGRAAAREQVELLARGADSIVVDDSSFTVGGRRYDQPGQSVLHTMQHPDHPGRFVSVFLTNGEEGWSRLRLITFYTRDTTIVWDGDKVLDRRVHEPDRRLRIEP